MNEIHHLIHLQLVLLKKKEFTGKLIVRSSDLQTEWTIYYCLGRLIWADGGVHPNRSWQRIILQHRSQFQNLDFRKVPDLECANFYALSLLVKQNYLSQEQVNNIISHKTTEIIFDIIQQEQKEELKYFEQPIDTDSLWEIGLNVSVSLVPVEYVIQEGQKSWSDWYKRGLQSWSPNLAPIINNDRLLQEVVSEITYKNFTRLLKGQLSLRDLAVRMKQDVLRITVSLASYVRKGLLNLTAIPDTEAIISPLGAPTVTSAKNTAHKPLVACIDDSPQIGQIMEHILSAAGYSFMSIQNPLEAIPKLISVKPALIFLDLTMPIINGYELCSQIKRVSQLKEIPILILTSSDGMVDRVRAKLVGASGFLAKPIKEDKILRTIGKFLISERGKNGSREAN